MQVDLLARHLKLIVSCFDLGQNLGIFRVRRPSKERDVKLRAINTLLLQKRIGKEQFPIGPVQNVKESVAVGL